MFCCGCSCRSKAYNLQNIDTESPIVLVSKSKEWPEQQQQQETMGGVNVKRMAPVVVKKQPATTVPPTSEINKKLVPDEAIIPKQEILREEPKMPIVQAPKTSDEHEPASKSATEPKPGPETEAPNLYDYLSNIKPDEQVTNIAEEIVSQSDSGSIGEESLASYGTGQDADEPQGAILSGSDVKEERRGAVMGLTGNLNINYKTYPKNRTQYEEIRVAMLRNDFLKNIIPADLLQDVIEAMWSKTVESKDVIIQQGDKGDTFYVSNNGRFKIIIDDQPYDIFDDQRVFGELAVLYNCPRAATIKAASQGLIWVLSREILHSILVKSAIQEEELRLSFLEKVPVIKEGSSEKLRTIAKLLKKNYFPPNTAIVQEGEPGSQFYIICAGTVTVTKFGVGIVATLKEGQFFGEKALLGTDVRQATVTANAPGVDCFILKRQDFIHYLGDLQTFIAEKPPVETDNAISIVQPSAAPVMEHENVRLSQLTRVQTLGVGGFGRVELVECHNKHTMAFALKSVTKYENSTPEQREHVFNEKNIQIACNFPFIVRLYRTFQDNKYLYYLMEACLGGDVFYQMQLQRGRHFAEEDAKFIAACVLEALAYLHDKDFIYRDLKPENMVIDSDGYIKLADFGFAKQMGKTDQTYTFAGTPEYVAPEVIYNRGHNRAVDYWAFGVFIFEMLVGKTPFKTNDPTYMKTYSLILSGIENIVFPKRVPKPAMSIIKKLCRLTPHERLGCQKRGAHDIREHRWFVGMKWEELRAKNVKSNFVPDLSNHKDVKYFEDFNEESKIPQDDPNHDLWTDF